MKHQHLVARKNVLCGSQAKDRTRFDRRPSLTKLLKTACSCSTCHHALETVHKIWSCQSVNQLLSVFTCLHLPVKRGNTKTRKKTHFKWCRSNSMTTTHQLTELIEAWHIFIKFTRIFFFPNSRENCPWLWNCKTIHEESYRKLGENGS